MNTESFNAFYSKISLDIALQKPSRLKKSNFITSSSILLNSTDRGFCKLFPNMDTFREILCIGLSKKSFHSFLISQDSKFKDLEKQVIGICKNCYKNKTSMCNHVVFQSKLIYCSANPSNSLEKFYKFNIGDSISIFHDSCEHVLVFNNLMSTKRKIIKSIRKTPSIKCFVCKDSSASFIVFNCKLMIKDPSSLCTECLNLLKYKSYDFIYFDLNSLLKGK